MKTDLKKETPRLYSVYRGIVTWPCFLTLLLLTALSAWCTCVVYPLTEKPWFMADSLVKQLLLCGLTPVLLAALLPLLQQAREKLDEPLFLRIRRCLLILIGALGLIWVLSTQYRPYFDRLWVQQAATSLAEGNASPFMGEGYIRAYQNQVGLVLFSRLLTAVFGDNNSIAFQVLNALCLPFIWLQLSRLGGFMGLGRGAQLAIVALGLIFLPLTIFTSFVYGTLMGLLLALTGMVLELRFLREGRWRLMVLSALCLGLAVLMKQNYLIFFIGAFLHLAAEIIRRRAFRRFAALALLAVAFLGQQWGPSFLLKAVWGIEMEGSGSSQLSWVAMALQENPYGVPGWWNSWNDDSWYIYSGMDTDKQNELALESLKESFGRFAADPAYAVDFFVQKNVSQWCDPAFQSLTLFQGKDHDQELPGWANSLMTLSGALKATRLLNYLQTLTYLGAALFVLLGLHRKNPDGLLPLVIFLGTFVFHTFWEAKGQYTLAAYVLLFPVALSGWLNAAGLLRSAFLRVRKGVALREPLPGKAHWIPMAVLALAAVCLLVVFRQCGALTSIRKDDAELRSRAAAADETWYAQYIADGEHTLRCDAGFLSVEDGKITLSAEEARWSTCNDNSTTRLWVVSDGLQNYLTEADGALTLSLYEYSGSQHWRIAPREGGYTLCSGDGQYLAAGNDGLYLTSNEEEATIWQID